MIHNKQLLSWLSIISIVHVMGVHAVTDVIFREYDIRGKVGEELRIDDVYNLSRAIAFYYKERKPDTKRIAVGMDVRTHSGTIAQELCKGLIESGLDVVLIGTCTSPMLYFATHMLDVDAGLMVTASHNPKEYNGIKICLGTECIWGKEIQVIKHMYTNNAHIPADKPGTVTESPIKDLYVNWLYEQFPHLIDCDISMVIDCGNGAASVVVPAIVEKMRWRNAHILYAEPDGTFPNHEADPIVEENMQDVRAAIVEYKADIGIGFDGDADRMGAMSSTGVLIPGDKMLALFAQQLIPLIPHLGVVFDINASAGLPEFLIRCGARPIMSPSGHSIILEQMNKHNALLGGELSCHFFFKDRFFGFDDGIYAAFRLVEVLHTTGKTIDALLASFPPKISSIQYRLPCPETIKRSLVDVVAIYFNNYPEARLITIDGLHVTMPYGWGLIRASNTQAVICFRFESDSQEGLDHIKRDFADALASAYDHNLYTTFGIKA